MLKTRDGPWKIQTFGGFVFEANSWCQSRKDCRNTKHSPQLFEIPEFVRIRRVCGVFWDGVDSSFSYTSKVTKQKRVYRYWRCLPGRKAIFLIDAFRTFASSVSGCIGFCLVLACQEENLHPRCQSTYWVYKLQETSRNDESMFYHVSSDVLCCVSLCELQADWCRSRSRVWETACQGNVFKNQDWKSRDTWWYAYTFARHAFPDKEIKRMIKYELECIGFGTILTVWYSLIGDCSSFWICSLSFQGARFLKSSKKTSRFWCTFEAGTRRVFEALRLEKRAFGCKRRFEICWFADLLYFHPFHLQ